MPEGTNSHTFEPAPSSAATLADADVVFLNGLRLEEPTLDLAEANVNGDTPIVALGEETITPEEYLFDFSFPEEAGKPNPHLWTNPLMATRYAEVVKDTLVELDPDNAAAFEANYAAYAERLAALDTALRTATETVPESQRQLLTYHDSFAYFAEEYGWTVVGAVQPSSFDEPTAREVAGLIDQVNDLELPAVFGSEVFPSPVLDRIASETGATYVDDLRDDDLPGEPGDADHTFLGLLQFDYVTMVEALGGDASALVACRRLRCHPRHGDVPAMTSTAPPGTAVRFDQVDFAYDDEPVLEGHRPRDRHPRLPRDRRAEWLGQDDAAAPAPRNSRPHARCRAAGRSG